MLKRTAQKPIDEQKPDGNGQVILEFTFCFIVVLLMIYGVTKVFFWAGRDLAERRKAHEQVLLGGPLPRNQIRTNFYVPVKMNAIWQGNN